VVCLFDRDHAELDCVNENARGIEQPARATCERRGTALPDGATPLAFTSEFYEDKNKIRQWKAFCNKNKPHVQEIEFNTLIDRLASFLIPVIRSAPTFSQGLKVAPWQITASIHHSCGKPGQSSKLCKARRVFCARLGCSAAR